jgi:hypothetical protein
VGKRGIFVYLEWGLWKKVLTLTVRGNSTCGGVVRRQRVPVFEGHRLALSGSRWDIRWLSGGGKTWFFVYLAWRLWKSVVRLAVRGIVFPVGMFGVRGCRCLRGIDWR